MSLIRRRPALPYVGLVAVVLAAYANHFQNGFHFDDRHTIVENPAIRSLANIPRFFTGATTFSTLPNTAAWRPLTSTSLAIDYWFGGGPEPFWFHLSTFVWFSALLVLIALLFRRIMDLADPHPSNRWTALAAAAVFGLHPAAAETVNYIIQRADLYNTLGVVASLLWFIAYPEQRKRGWYLLPAVGAYLAQAPALIYPLILVAYLFLFEQKADRKQWGASVRAAWPALAVTALIAYATLWLTPSTYQPGAGLDAALYRLTQPWIAAHYFRSFFMPTSLAVDQFWPLASSAFSPKALAGDAFVIALLAVAVYTARRRETRPIAFGVIWFFLALLPTALLPQSNPAADDRMFFPFIGLTLAAVWSVRLLAFHWAFARRAAAIAALLVVVLAAETHIRNNAWRTDESLWYDAMQKDPDNPRALMHYGLALMDRGDSARALPYLERARADLPTDSDVLLALGRAYAAQGRDEQADRSLQTAVQLKPEPPLYFEYALWLKKHGRLPQARWCIETGIKTAGGSQLYPEARELLMEIYAEQEDWKSLDALVQYMLHVMPDNQVARRFAAARMTRQSTPSASEAVDTNLSPEELLNRSAEYCKSGKYQQCLDAAMQTLRLRPRWAEAYGNMSVALLAMHRWDEGIQAAQQALVIKPDYVAAKKNLEWALKQRRKK